MSDIQQIIQSVANIDSTTSSNSSSTDAKLSNLISHVTNIENSLSGLLSNGSIPSQINAQNRLNEQDAATPSGQSTRFRQAYQNGWGNRNNLFDQRRFGRNMDGFLDEFEDALIQGLIGSDFENQIKDIFQGFADQLGVNIKQLPGEIGKRLGQNAAKALRDTNLGQQVFGHVDTLKQRGLNYLQGRGQTFVNSMLSNGGDAASQAAAGQVAASQAATAESATVAAEGMTQLGLAVPELAAVVIAATAAFWLLDKALDNVSQAFEGISDLVKAFSAVAKRDQTSRSQNIKLANERLTADIKTMVEQPFKILEDAANAWYQAWDSQLKTISATQGYTKADVQDLMSAYSQRLQSEELTSYISGADITTNLAKVLESGLSGRVAEEFAYQATKLNAAVPTQDFFNFASTYSSIAANAMRDGQSQSEAIETANTSLKEFTSGLLYASRELSGGFTTGLKDASSLYEQAAKIAQTSRTGDVSGIASVLLAVRGELGAVAPDLASSITDTIYKLLTGGNASDIVALRSLAGVNASNTEFLKAVSENPKKIFSALFQNLANMYNQSPDAYMEKAEGFAQLFGISSEAFARIDFNELAQAISRMNMDNASLNENLALLVDGQTTTTAEQLKNQQINQYMIEEGLSLVLDNDAARAIQQHMWDEQIARELQEATYAVDLQGSALSALEKIMSAVQNILLFLNPMGMLFAGIKSISNIISTTQEIVAQDKDIRQILELRKVGSSNTAARSMYQLTTRNADLNLTPDLVTLLGGDSRYGAASGRTQLIQALTNPLYAAADRSKLASNLIGALSSKFSNEANMPSSKYSWGSVGKSTAKLADTLLRQSNTTLAPAITYSGTSTASSSAAAAKSSVDRMLADSYLVDKFIKEGKGFDEWAATATKFGITDLDQAIEAAGYNKADIEEYFQRKETERGLEEAEAIRAHEKEFRNTGITFWSEQFPTDYRDPLFNYIETANSLLQDIYDEQVAIYEEQQAFRNYYKTAWIEKGWASYVSTGSSSNGLFNKFYTEFMNYFIRHTYYDATSGYKYSDVEAIQKKVSEQERGDTVYALAEMLTKNLVDLKDPTMQTNVLLAQILVVVNAIMNQQNESTGTASQNTLLNSLSAMALGLTSNTETGSTT